MSDSVTPAMSPSNTTLPSRSTVMVSQMVMTSLSLWEMNTMDTPSSRTARIMSNTRPISTSVSEVVGSSMIMIFA